MSRRLLASLENILQRTDSDSARQQESGQDLHELESEPNVIVSNIISRPSESSVTLTIREFFYHLREFLFHVDAAFYHFMAIVSGLANW